MSSRSTAARFFGKIATIVIAVGAITGGAEASFPPKKMHISRDKVADACNALGVSGRGIGLDAASGKYGCENLASGSTLLCEELGECKYYFYDPRTKWFKKDPDSNRIIVIPAVRGV